MDETFPETLNVVTELFSITVNVPEMFSNKTLLPTKNGLAKEVITWVVPELES